MPKPVRCCATCSMQRLAAARPATCLAPFVETAAVAEAARSSSAPARRAPPWPKAVEDAQWPHPLEGLVVTRYGCGEACRGSRSSRPHTPCPTREGAPRPAASSSGSGGPHAGRSRALPDLGRRVGPAGAARAGLTLADKQGRVNRALLKSGANIVEMNTVRMHLSAIGGGRLAIAAQPRAR